MKLLPESPYINYYREWLKIPEQHDTIRAYVQTLVKAKNNWLAHITEKLLAFQIEFNLSNVELTRRFSRETTKKMVDGHLEITLTIYYNCGTCLDPRAHKFAESTLSV